jgi:hypothetical protein
MTSELALSLRQYGCYPYDSPRAKLVYFLYTCAWT